MEQPYAADANQMFLAADGSMMCEKHPGYEWGECPGGLECPGPGMPWILRGRTLIEEVKQAAEALVKIALLEQELEEAKSMVMQVREARDRWKARAEALRKERSKVSAEYPNKAGVEATEPSHTDPPSTLVSGAADADRRLLRQQVEALERAWRAYVEANHRIDATTVTDRGAVRLHCADELAAVLASLRDQETP